MNKKAIAGIIIGALTTVAILGAIYYFFIYKPSSTPVRDSSNTNYFPFGNSGSDNNNSGVADTNNNTPSSPVEIPKLRRIWSDPVSGFIAYEKKATSTATTTETIVHFSEISTGHIFETKNTETFTTRLSNTTLPKFNDVYFLGPISFIGRKWDSDSSAIETYIGSIVGQTSTSTSDLQVKGNNLTSNINSVAVSGNKLFSLYTSIAGSLGYIESPAGSKDVLVFKSPLSNWNIDWVGENHITFETKPSAEELGYLFVFDTNTKTFKSLAAKIYGLTAKANFDATKIIYNESSKSLFSTFYKNTKTESIIQLRSRTIPEKCIWSKKEKNIVYCFVPKQIPSGEYPDDWYKGRVEFADNLVKIDTDSGAESVLVNLSNESGSDIDAVKPSLNQPENYIYFINKRDGSFWSYDLRP